MKHLILFSALFFCISINNVYTQKNNINLFPLFLSENSFENVLENEYIIERYFWHDSLSELKGEKQYALISQLQKDKSLNFYGVESPDSINYYAYSISFYEEDAQPALLNISVEELFKIYIVYHKNGIIKEITQYDNDVFDINQTGWKVEYDEIGRLIRKSYAQRGNILFEEEYNHSASEIEYKYFNKKGSSSFFLDFIPKACSYKEHDSGRTREYKYKERDVNNKSLSAGSFILDDDNTYLSYIFSSPDTLHPYSYTVKYKEDKTPESLYISVKNLFHYQITYHKNGFIKEIINYNSLFQNNGWKVEYDEYGYIINKTYFDNGTEIINTNFTPPNDKIKLKIVNW
jgi:antitoxin component YwqK of YwqJK toxin-antitoxin module